MTVRLRPMPEDEFAHWAEDSRAWYAWDMVEHAGIAPDVAQRKAEANNAATFPEGLATSGNVLLVVEEEAAPIGSIWFAVREEHGAEYAYLYAIRLDEKHRGRGLGREAMRALEREVRARGLDRIQLNAFGGNKRARGLYRTLGYEELSVQMGKKLE